MANLNELKAMKRADIANARYEAETRGIELNGAKFDTSREGQARIVGIALQTFVNPNYSCRFKTKDGFVLLNARQIMILAKSVREHVQLCFDQEAILCKEINACETAEELEDIKWEGKPILDGGSADNTPEVWNDTTKV